MSNAIKAKAKEKTALKLLTKYAEEYHTLEKINQELAKQNNDLKTTLKINKDIIEGYILKGIKDKNSFLIEKQNEEISYISTRLNEVVNELNKSKQLMAMTQNTAKKFENELEAAKRKVFVLENAMQEKENIIKGFYENELHNRYNRKRSPCNKIGNDKKIPIVKQPNIVDRDNRKKDSANVHNSSSNHHQRINSEIIYIASPNCILNQIHSELAFVQDDNNRLKKEIHLLKEKIALKENGIKLLEMKIKESNADISNQKDKDQDQESNKNKLKAKGKGIEANNQITNKANILFKQLEDNSELNILQIKAINTDEEWRHTLKSNDMTQDEYNRLTRLLLMKKPCAIIDALNKILSEKNEYLKVILQENKRLISSNLKLNKVNMEQSYKLSSSFQINNKRNQFQENSSSAYLSTYCNGCSLKLNDNNQENTNTEVQHLNTFESEEHEEQNRTIIQNMHNISMSSSLNSNDFRIGIALDKFDLLSELSNKKYRINTKE